MTRRRRWMALAALGALVAGSAFDVATGREHWPLSPYPMYSDVELDRTTTKLQLEGVPAEPGAGEVALWRGETIAPFDKTRLASALGRLSRRPDAQRLLRTAALDVARRYERRRRDGELDGPPLAAVRLYERGWRLRPDAGNLDRPDAKRLLLEVAL